MNLTQKYGYASTPLSREKIYMLAGVFFTLLAALYFVGMNWYGLFDVDEAIFTQASTEMRESGNYIAPTYNGEPRYHKPPLIYWVQAASLSIFGEKSLIGARLPSALFSFLTVLGFFLFLRNRLSPRLALTASAILGFNLSWLIIARAATADAALNFFILTSTLLLLDLIYIRATLFKQVLVGFLLAGGMLTKGPIALFVPGVITLLAWCFKPHVLKNIWATNPIVIGGALIAGILPWFALIIGLNGWDFFTEFWLVHNWGRFTADLGNSHSSSYFYYLFILLFGFFPWVFYLFQCALSLKPTTLLQQLRSPDPHTAWPILGFVGGVCVVLFFSLSGTKLAHYILPALPLFALFIANGIEHLPKHIHHTSYTLLFLPFTAFLAFIFLCFNPLLGMLKTATTDPSPVFNWLQRFIGFDWPPQDALTLGILGQNIPTTIAPYAIAFILIFGILHGMSIASRGFRHGIALTAMSMCFVLMLMIAGIVPKVDQYTQAPLRTLAQHIKDKPQHAVYHLGLHKPSVRWLSQKPFIGLDAPSQLKQRLKKGHGLILHEKHIFTAITQNLPQNIIWQPPVCTGGFCVLEIHYE